MMVRRALASLCGVVAVVYVVTARAQDSRSVRDGVFTAEQAKRGEVVYRESCVACHGEGLTGAQGPALTGDAFLTTWTGFSVGDLFQRTKESMPANAPGRLTARQTADLMAYVLSVAKYPTGSAELPQDTRTLNTIAIEAR